MSDVPHVADHTPHGAQPPAEIPAPAAASPPGPARARAPWWRRVPPGRAAIVAVLAAISAATIYPLLFMLFTALKGRKEYLFNRYGPPARPTLVNFWNALTFGRMGRYALNSLVVTTLAVAIAWVVCSLAAYALSHLRFRGRRAAFLGILGAMMIAPQVIVVPLYTMLVGMGLVNSHVGLALVYVALGIPFGTYLLTSYFRAIPRELVEAAQMDGAGHLRTLWHVIVPVARPALVTLGIFNFLWMWNELLFSLLILQDDSVRTLMVGVANLRGQYTTNIPLLSAGLFIAALPVLVVFFLFQARLAKGMTAGAVK